MAAKLQSYYGCEVDVLCAYSIREQRRSVTVLLAGTSGTGKSTLAGEHSQKEHLSPMCCMWPFCKPASCSARRL